MAQQMTDGYTFNRVEFTANEETCILKYLVRGTKSQPQVMMNNGNQ
jgi:hypothetical protein